MGQVFRRTYRSTDGRVKTCETWTIRYFRNGRPIQESTKFRKNQKGRAQRLLKLREGDIAKGLPVSPAIQRITFDEAAEDVVRDYKNNGKRTLAHVERRIEKHLKPYFGGRRLSSITATDIRAF